MEFNGNTQDSVNQGDQTPGNEPNDQGDDNNVGSNSQNDLAPKHIDNYEIEDFQKHIRAGGQILKTRDDSTVTLLESDGDDKFKLKDVGGERCSWAKEIGKGEIFPSGSLRTRIEPWLTALVQSDHLSLLVGTGLSLAAHSIATDKEWPVSCDTQFVAFEEEIEKGAKRRAENAGRKSEGAASFEDKLQVAYEISRGLEILGAEKTNCFQQFDKHVQELEDTLKSFTESVLEAERNLLNGTRSKKAFSYLISFLMSFASRTGPRERLRLFTTNYDRVIEATADVAGLRLMDRFVGALSPIFRAARLDIDMHYNPPGIRGEPSYLEGVARFTKLHGSLDWSDTGETIRKIGLPFGAESSNPYLKTPRSVMIYPNAAKDHETTSYPYVELFRDFAEAICRPNSTLVCYGYSLGDDHINRVIKDMLTIPSTHLVIVSFDDPFGRVMSTYKELGKSNQITLLLGHHLGDLKTLVKYYLPKPAIDLATGRMTDLIEKRLRHRWGDENTSKDTQQSNNVQSSGTGT